MSQKSKKIELNDSSSSEDSSNNSGKKKQMNSPLLARMKPKGMQNRLKDLVVAQIQMKNEDLIEKVHDNCKKEGWIRIKFKHKGSFQKVYVVLRNDHHCYYFSSKKKTINPKGVINLLDTYFYAKEKSKTFQLIHHDSNYLVFKCKTDKETKEWVKAFRSSGRKISPYIHHKQNRTFITGYCMKEGGSYKSWKKRWIKVTENFFMYYQNEEADYPINTISLANAVVQIEFNSMQEKKVLKIHFPKRRDYLLYPVSDNKKEYDDLLQHWYLRIKIQAKKSTLEIQKHSKMYLKKENFYDGYLLISKGSEEPNEHWAILDGFLLSWYKTETKLGEPLDSISCLNLKVTIKKTNDADYMLLEHPSFQRPLTVSASDPIEFETFLETLREVIRKYSILIKQYQNYEKENYLSISENGNKYVRRFFKIKNNHFIGYQSKSDQNSSLIEIPLKGAQIIPWFNGRRHCEFQIKILKNKNNNNSSSSSSSNKQKKKIYKFFANSRKDFDQWILSLHVAVTKADNIDIDKIKILEKSKTRLTKTDLVKLRGISEFSDKELNSLYKKFISEYNRGKMNQEMFKIFAHGLNIKSPTSIELLYFGMDRDKNGLIDFEEIVLGLHCLTKGTDEEKCEFAFFCYDADGKYAVSLNDLWRVVCLLEPSFNFEEEVDPRVSIAFQNLDNDNNGTLELSEFRDASLKGYSFLVEIIPFIKLSKKRRRKSTKDHK
ncbi:hypothetical protein M0812_12430 [Anaeramoeba flamelloides]|uniref:Uncharacterized protein n=1 Tax=Anaeramoeba flamelloides TaxID=1746091 RepID=A0AAV7ZNL4_9EUKA|nr:hypothetical protein M0812_12430 [Anaeramoeba flamelloides]